MTAIQNLEQDLNALARLLNTGLITKAQYDQWKAAAMQNSGLMLLSVEPAQKRKRNGKEK